MRLLVCLRQVASWKSEPELNYYIMYDVGRKVYTTLVVKPINKRHTTIRYDVT